MSENLLNLLDAIENNDSVWIQKYVSEFHFDPGWQNYFLKSKLKYLEKKELLHISKDGLFVTKKGSELLSSRFKLTI